MKIVYLTFHLTEIKLHMICVYSYQSLKVARFRSSRVVGDVQTILLRNKAVQHFISLENVNKSKVRGFIFVQCVTKVTSYFNMLRKIV